jgi:hypothetical protein
MKPVKLSLKTLRSLIKEIQMPPNFSSSISEIDLHTWRDQWADAMKAQYNPNDPSMEALGQQEWHNQVEAAAGDLWDALVDAVADVEGALINGEYLSRGPGR